MQVTFPHCHPPILDLGIIPFWASLPATSFVGLWNPFRVENRDVLVTVFYIGQYPKGFLSTLFKFKMKARVANVIVCESLGVEFTLAKLEIRFPFLLG